MVTKWFIGVSAKSRGFFTGWNYRKEVKPSFTKQTALADSFNTKDEADAYLKKERDKNKECMDDDLKTLKELKVIKRDWKEMLFDKKVEYCKRFRFAPTLNDSKNSYGYSRRLSYYSKSTFTDIERDAIENNIRWEYQIKRYEDSIQVFKERIEYIDTKLIVREQEIEIKFKDNERREIKWVQRKDNDTAHSYCNCCGGAIPSIPQLVIGRRWSNQTFICAICMGKLAQEATIQAGKIPEDILKQYEGDRFLREI